MMGMYLKVNLIWGHGLKILPVFSMLICVTACSLSRPLDEGVSPQEETTHAVENRIIFDGVIKRGAELGGVKDYCPEGLYLVADNGFLVGQTRMLLLRLPGPPATVLSDQDYIGKKVEVEGKYPAQEIFCEALICQCEDYILVERINFR
jgi:hypothetical protein